MLLPLPHAHSHVPLASILLVLMTSINAIYAIPLLVSLVLILPIHALPVILPPTIDGYTTSRVCTCARMGTRPTM